MDSRVQAVIKNTKPNSDERILGVLICNLAYAPRFHHVAGAITRQTGQRWDEARFKAALSGIEPHLWPSVRQESRQSMLFGGTKP